VTGLIDLCERGYIPDALARLGMRRLIAERLASENQGGPEAASRRLALLVAELRTSPIAIETHQANSQHYEVPAEFFHLHLGPCLKYSSCLYPKGTESLAEAEQAMLETVSTRAGLANGQRILDLGCGWGSLSLWLAQRFPDSQIVGLSNSRGQRQFILDEARARSVTNLEIVTGNVAEFDFPSNGQTAGFDRIVSIEMFEHMKNYGALLAKLARWMRADARLFVHIFAHRTLAYHFEEKDRSDWMTRYFFAGGIMPSQNLLLHFQDHVQVLDTWWVDGRHYERTANDWLAGMDRARASILEVFRGCYGADEAVVWLNRWRMFYMAVAELFGYRDGQEWGVGHYLFAKRDVA
jgi:cyclopropane-fatty-acyl-phospholipid synthase